MNTTKIETSSGRIIDLFDPKPDDLYLPDIVQSLKRLHRFNGHTSVRYTVFQHCTMCAAEAVSRGYSETVVKSCLMHDFAEAYIGDMAYPLKQNFPQYLELEIRFEDVLAERWGFQTSPEVTEIDRDMAVYEARHFMPSQAMDDRWREWKSDYFQPASSLVQRQLSNPDILIAEVIFNTFVADYNLG